MFLWDQSTPEGRKNSREPGRMMAKREKAFYQCLSEAGIEALRYLLDKLLIAHRWSVE
jgi:hypothetical protein